MAVLDFRALPYPDESFYLVAFDPPHLVRAGRKSWRAANPHNNRIPNMAFIKTPKQPASGAADQYISKAPDSSAKAVAQIPEVAQNKKPITITFDPTLLAQLDAAARRIGISRSAALAVAVSKWLGID